MPTTRIVEAIDVFEDRHLSLPPRFPRPSPDQFSLDGLEERLDRRIVIAINSCRTRGFLETSKDSHFHITDIGQMAALSRIAVLYRMSNAVSAFGTAPPGG